MDKEEINKIKTKLHSDIEMIMVADALALMGADRFNARVQRELVFRIFSKVELRVNELIKGLSNTKVE